MSKQSSSPQLQETKMNPLLWFLLVVLVPTLVAIVIAVVILSMVGINVGEWVQKTGSNIPVISSFIKTDEERNIEELEDKYLKTIEEKDREITELEETVEQHVYHIDQLTEEVQEAEQQLFERVDPEETEQEEDSSTEHTIKEMAASYQKMNHTQAAMIIEEMDLVLALALLHELPNDVRGKIIGKMDAEKAVTITEEYMNQTQQ